jgi:pimeloyl-ACP methyl ester carboxylesterase
VLDPKLACRKIFDEIANQEDHGLLKTLVDDACGFDDLDVRPPRSGPLLLLDLLNAYRMFVPDLSFTVEEQVREGRKVITYWSATGSHRGIAERLPPSRATIRLRGTLVATTSSRGRLEHLRGSWDVGGFVQQVGVERRRFNALLAPAHDTVPIRAVAHVDGVPILFFPTLSLPGWCTWKYFVDDLKARRPVINFQALGNRRAFEGDPVTRDYGVKAENRALHVALERAGIRPPYDIVGHSVGGTAAVDFALDHPRETRSMTLIEPGLSWVLQGRGRLDPATRAFLRQRLARYSGPVTKARYASLLRHSYGIKGYDPRPKPYWPNLCAYMRNMMFRKAFLMHSDNPQRLTQLRCPVLLIQGTESDPFHRNVMRTLDSLLPHTQYVEMPGGHVPHFGDGREPFLRLLRQFHSSLHHRAA